MNAIVQVTMLAFVEWPANESIYKGKDIHKRMVLRRS